MNSRLFHGSIICKVFDLYSLEDRGARGNVVVKALCCKPEGRGFDSR
jgi:hypothetical protein